MKKLFFIAFFAIVVFSVGATEFDTAWRELHHNYDFVESYAVCSEFADTYATIVFNDNIGIAILIEQRELLTIVSVYCQAGNKAAAIKAKCFSARELNGGSMNIVATGIPDVRGIRIISTAS